MRKIARAIIKQTIERGFMRTKSLDPHDKPGYQGEPSEYLTEVARKQVMGQLEKYISFQDHFNAYWVDRYWYFDVEKYQDDLATFGIDVAKAIKSGIAIPGADEFR